MQRRLDKYKAASPLESHKEFNWKLLKECETRADDRVEPVEIFVCTFSQDAKPFYSSRGKNIIYSAQRVSAGSDKKS